MTFVSTRNVIEDLREGVRSIPALVHGQDVPLLVGDPAQLRQALPRSSIS